MFTPQAQKVFDEYEKRRSSEDLSAITEENRDAFLLPIGQKAGVFLHSLIVAGDAQIIVELGTSYGYSTLFLADAARRTGGRVITMDLDERKQAYAREKLHEAELLEFVEFQCGDAIALIGEIEADIDFVLVDIWKDLYAPCFKAFYPKLSQEAVIAADNMIHPKSAREEVRQYRALVREKKDLQSMLLPVGNGLELSCRWSVDSDKL